MVGSLKQYDDPATFAAEHPLECDDMEEDEIVEAMEEYNGRIARLNQKNLKRRRDEERDKQSKAAGSLGKLREMATSVAPSLLDTLTKTLRKVRPLMAEYGTYIELAGHPPSLDSETTRLVGMIHKLEPPVASSSTVEAVEAVRSENRRLKELLFHQAVVFNRTCDDFTIGDVTHRGCKFNSCVNKAGRCHNSACKVHAAMKIAHPDKIRDDLVFDFTLIARWQSERNSAVRESDLSEGYIVPVGPGGWKANAAKTA